MADHNIHNLQAALFGQWYRSNGVISVPSLDYLCNKLSQQEWHISQPA